MLDGKLVGAVTHVLVNDSTKGYGIFIGNAIEHGVEEKECANQIEIVIRRTKDGAVRVSVSDDGEGMKKEEIATLKARISKKQCREERRFVECESEADQLLF